ncbi:MAG TPA: hypothetical protein VF179_02795 [Thermoanaerobaculia bacterium]|nr:hypothetical protein [Thermoanaerobaculia bacterium]
MGRPPYPLGRPLYPFLEEEEGGHRLAGDFEIAEDGHHLVGEIADFGGLSLLQVRDRQIEGGERGVEGVALVEKRPADLGQKPAGPFVISKAGDYQGGRKGQGRRGTAWH